MESRAEASKQAAQRSTAGLRQGAAEASSAVRTHHHGDMLGHIGEPRNKGDSHGSRSVEEHAGVQDAEKADLGSQMLRIGSYCEHGFRAGAEQQVIEHRGVSLAKRIQLVWQGKDHMEVGDAEQFLLARRKPALTCLGLALLGTVPVATGVIRDGRMTAARTAIHMTAKRCGAATAQRPKNGQLLVAQPGSVLFDEAIPLRAEQVGHLHGGTAHSDSGLRSFLDRWS